MAERPRAACCTLFTINDERYSQKGKIVFLSHPLATLRVYVGASSQVFCKMSNYPKFIIKLLLNFY